MDYQFPFGKKEKKNVDPWLRKTSSDADAWLSSGFGEAIDGRDGASVV